MPLIRPWQPKPPPATHLAGTCTGPCCAVTFTASCSRCGQDAPWTARKVGDRDIATNDCPCVKEPAA